MTKDWHTSHMPSEPEDTLGLERYALRMVLNRVMKEIEDVGTQATYVSRLASASVQAARAQHAIGARGVETILEYLRPTLEELDYMDTATGEGEDTP